MLKNYIMPSDRPRDRSDILLPWSVLYFTLGNYQRSFEILSELVLNNKDTTDFILDWEYGFDRLDEKRMMIL